MTPGLVDETKQLILKLRPESEPQWGGMAVSATLAHCTAGIASQGAACCTSYPHPFFGTLNPQQWASLMYKHVDHHLRQFGV